MKLRMQRGKKRGATKRDANVSTATWFNQKLVPEFKWQSFFQSISLCGCKPGGVFHVLFSAASLACLSIGRVQKNFSPVYRSSLSFHGKEAWHWAVTPVRLDASCWLFKLISLQLQRPVSDIHVGEKFAITVNHGRLNIGNKHHHWMYPTFCEVKLHSWLLFFFCLNLEIKK